MCEYCRFRRIFPFLFLLNTFYVLQWHNGLHKEKRTFIFHYLSFFSLSRVQLWNDIIENCVFVGIAFWSGYGYIVSVVQFVEIEIHMANTFIASIMGQRDRNSKFRRNSFRSFTSFTSFHAQLRWRYKKSKQMKSICIFNDLCIFVWN